MRCSLCSRRVSSLVFIVQLMLGRAWAARVFDADMTGKSHWSIRKLKARQSLYQDMQPVPLAGTCRLSWYTATPPKFGNTVLCNGSSEDNCLQPCVAGFEKLQNSSMCLQKCPDEAAGPAHLCPISRTCIRAEGVCPMLVDVPYLCPVPDQFLGACAKQSYQAIEASHKLNEPCSGKFYKDYTGKWRCAEGENPEPCAPGFKQISALSPGLGSRCTQVCPPWLVDCGESCHMPGVPCAESAQVLCPVASLTACSLDERSNLALQTACQHEGFRGLGGCPLSLKMHGSCAGAKLQVKTGLRHGGFLRIVEAWWGPVVGAEPLPDNYDGPLRAVRLTFSDNLKEPVVFGNASHALGSSPRMTFKMNPNELIVSTNLWSSSSVMDGTSLTPLLAGFSIFTSGKSSWTAGGMTNWDGIVGNARVGSALSSWEQHVSLSGKDLGVGLPVGAAAYSSDAGVHAFGLIYFAKVAKQEL